MTKAMFGIAAALAMMTTPAWAEDDGSKKQSSRDTVAVSERSGKTVAKVAKHSVDERATASGTGSAAQAGTGSAEASSRDASSHEARWLVEREGYRDGGY